MTGVIFLLFPFISFCGFASLSLRVLGNFFVEPGFCHAGQVRSIHKQYNVEYSTSFVPKWSLWFFGDLVVYVLLRICNPFGSAFSEL